MFFFDCHIASDNVFALLNTPKYRTIKGTLCLLFTFQNVNQKPRVDYPFLNNKVCMFVLHVIRQFINRIYHSLYANHRVLSFNNSI